MKISAKDWLNYVKTLGRLSEEAGRQMVKYIQANGIDDNAALIEYAHALATKYGEGSAELACAMYDAIAEIQGAAVGYAVPAETASISETAKAINGSLKQSPAGELLEGVVSRLVKQAGADTTLKNALRDGAEFAWIPDGGACAFCISLAANGWQPASKDAVKNGHAEHIHANCNCEYAIRFSPRMNVAGYNPDEYKKMYYDAPGKSPKDKINALRREFYEEEKEG